MVLVNNDDIDRVLCQLLLDGKEGLHSFSLIVRMMMNDDDGQVLQLVNGIYPAGFDRIQLEKFQDDFPCHFHTKHISHF